MSKPITKIVIVGGGTAGWLSAAYMLRWLQIRNIEDSSVTLVESDEIGTIGVGEATIPDIKESLNFLQIDEDEFMARTNATFKTAIKFVNWRENPDEAGEHAYYHPFERPPNVNGVPMWNLWLAAKWEQNLKFSFPETAGLAQTLCENSRSPKTLKDEAFKSRSNYAYHIDAVLFGRYLRTLSVMRGAHHIVDTVTEVRRGEDGRITSVVGEKSGVIGGELFIDASGFRGLLINETLESRFLTYSDSLYCDRAISLQVPYPGKFGTVNPFTTSTAASSGWIWEIHLYGQEGGDGGTRRGFGYVFASNFISDDDAEKELRAHIGPSAEGIEARQLPMRVGRSESPWIKNCVAIGLSAGFIEPLESTGISLIIMALKQLMENFPTTGFSPSLAAAYNDSMSRFQGHLKEFIHLHYCLTRRTDSEFWKANRDCVLPEPLLQKIQTWRRRAPNDWDNSSGFQFFPSYSYQCILSGLDHIPDIDDFTGTRLSPSVIKKYVTQHSTFIREALIEYPDHMGILNIIHGK